MAPLLLFLISFGFALARVSPTVYGGDTGELIASSAILGIPHAPAFPLYNIVAKFFQGLIPFGNIAYRTNLTSALWMSLVLVLFWILTKKILRDQFSLLIGILGVLVLSISPLYVSQALAAEVFGLNAVLLLGIFILLYPLLEGEHHLKARTHLILAVFLFGLGLGNHHILIVLLPVLAWALWKTEGAVRDVKILLTFFILGLSLYLYLPLRAKMNPAVNFGNPDTLSRFWDVLIRKEFGSFSLHPASVPFYEPSLVLWDWLRFWTRSLHQVGWSGMTLGVVGVILGWMAHRKTTTLLFLSAWILLGFGFELFSNLSPGSAIAQWRLERFFLIPTLALIGLMTQGIGFGLLKNKATKILVCCLGLLFVAEKILAGPALLNLRNNFVFRDFALSVFRSAPRKTKLVIDRVLFDEPTSSMLVLNQTEKKRTDIDFYYRPGTLFNQKYGADYLQLSWDKRFQRQVKVEVSLRADQTKNVTMLAFEKNNAPFASPRLSGFIYHKYPRNIQNPSFLRYIAINRYQNMLTELDYSRRLMLVHFSYFSAKIFLELQQFNLANQWFQIARHWGSDMAWLQSNMGGLYSHLDQIPRAREYFQSTVQLDPYFYQGYFGLGFTAIKLGYYDEAISLYKRGIRLSPLNADAHYMLGVAYTYANRNQEAIKPWRRFLSLDPQNPQAPVVKKLLESGINR